MEEGSYWKKLFCWHRYLLDQGMFGDAVTCVKCGESFYASELAVALYKLFGKVEYGKYGTSCTK